MLYGVHISNSNLINNIRTILDIYNIRYFQCFTKSPQKTYTKIKFTDIYNKEINSFLIKNKVTLFVHAQYTINLIRRNKNAVNSVIDDINWLNIVSVEPTLTGVIIHMGKNTTNIEIKEVLNNFKSQVEYILDNTSGTNLIFETSCGSKNDIFYDLQVLSTFYHSFEQKYKNRLKICIDTCHVFVSGYDLRSKQQIFDFFKLIDNLFSMKNIICFHLNDSKTDFNGKTDRHAPLTTGHIFKDNVDVLLEFINCAKNYNIPCISETNGLIEDEIKFF